MLQSVFPESSRVRSEAIVEFRRLTRAEVSLPKREAVKLTIDDRRLVLVLRFLESAHMWLIPSEHGCVYKLVQ